MDQPSSFSTTMGLQIGGFFVCESLQLTFPLLYCISAGQHPNAGRCKLTTAALPALGQEVIKLSTSTRTENPGLLKYLLPLLPAFEAKTRGKDRQLQGGRSTNVLPVGAQVEA